MERTLRLDGDVGSLATLTRSVRQMAARKKSSGGRKYGKAAGKSVKRAMHKRKSGTLKSGSGRKVTSRKQAIAIGLSEARESGAKVPRKRSSSRKSSGGRKKSTRKKSSSR
jgi:hypothetical protein